MPEVPIAKQYNEISSMLKDTMVQVAITVHQKLKEKRTHDTVYKALERVLEESRGNKGVLYKLKIADKGVSVFAFNGLVVASLSDSGDVVDRDRLREVLGSGGTVEVWMVEIGVLSDDVVEILESVVEEVKEPPNAWVNRTLLGFTVEGVLSVKGAFSYVLKARAPWGELVAIKVARDRDESGRPLVLGDRASSVIYKLVGEAGVLQKIHSINDRLLRVFLRARGYSEDLAGNLIKYKDNVIKVYAVYAPFTRYRGIEEYVSNPPFAVFELADGDLDDVIKFANSKRGQGVAGRVDRLVESIVLQIAGALALAHAVGVGHFDLKPANVLYKKNGSGVAVKLADFSGYNQVDGEFIVDVVTLEYGDPTILFNRGRGASLSSDVFEWGAMVARLYKGRPILCHFAINSIILSRITGQRGFEQTAAEMARRLGGDYEKYFNVVRDSLREALSSGNEAGHMLASRVESDYNKCLELELQGIPEDVYGVVKKALRLTPESKFKDMIQVYEILKDILKP